MNDILQPFLKWAGGKRWFVSNYKDILPDPKSINTYYEPFLGGGAIFFYMNPKKGVLSDINPDLINVYETIRSNWNELEKLLQKYELIHSEEFYYKMRSEIPPDSLLKAARFIYLNRTCWNGLYRVNKKGLFNVPIGTKTKIVLDGDNFEKIASSLTKIQLKCCDFEETIDRAIEGDFVFIDPPYTVKHNNNGFIKYNENIFSWNDQIRLKNAIERCLERGVKVLLTNANHQSIKDLYNGLGNISFLERNSVIAGKSQNRGIFSELIFKSW